MFNKKTATRTILKNMLRALLAVLVAALIIMFLSKQITQTANSVVEKKKAALFLQKRSQVIADVGSDLAIVGGNFGKIEAALPPDDNIAAFLSTLQDMARQNSVDQPPPRVGAPAASGITNGAITLSSIDYSLSLNGTVVTFTNYLKAFEQLPYFTGIKAISLNAPGGWEGNSSISISAQLYAKQSQ